MKNEEGYIKFNTQWTKEKLLLDDSMLTDFNNTRSKLKKRNWLGVLPNHIGFGNLSKRTHDQEFLISGSASGALNTLEAKHISLVTEVNIGANTLKCKGETLASSESMTHAACYLANALIGAVIHIHDANLWVKHLHSLPTSTTEAAYGTPEMAISIAEMINGETGLIVMGGHRDGLIAYGRNLDEAFELLTRL